MHACLDSIWHRVPGPPPPSGIGMVSESCWPNMMPNLRLPRRWKLNWVNWSSPWGMSKARVPPKLAALLALWCFPGSGESQMTGMTWVLGNRVNTYAKVTDWCQMMWFLFDWDHKVLTTSFTSYLDSPRKLREMLARTASSIQVEVESTWHPMFLVRPML